MKKKSYMPKQRQVSSMPSMPGAPKYPGYDSPQSAFLAGNFAPSMQPVMQQKIKPTKKLY